VFFQDAVEHTARLARILRQPRGNALLVGVGGSGKRSLARFAAHLSGCACVSIELTRNYGPAEFREDLRRLYRWAAVCRGGAALQSGFVLGAAGREGGPGGDARAPARPRGLLCAHGRSARHMRELPAPCLACCRRAGVAGERVVFLLSDTQVVSESFLEDVNNVLNSGEVGGRCAVLCSGGRLPAGLLPGSLAGRWCELAASICC
jgi:hypothetical protein